MSEIASSVTKIESKNPNQSWLDAGRIAVSFIRNISDGMSDVGGMKY